MNKEETVIFDRKMLVKLIVPMVIEQLLSVTVGMADMIMVSGAGEEAVSGISLVNSINVLLIMVLRRWLREVLWWYRSCWEAATGKKACKGANQQMMICILIAVVVTAAALVFNRNILVLIYGSVDALVMENAVKYFYITALSFPFLAVYNAGSALFRVMGNSHISMFMSVIMNVINIAGNAVCFWVPHGSGGRRLPHPDFQVCGGAGAAGADQERKASRPCG